MTTIRQALALGRTRLAQSPSPELDARLLLAHVLDRPHSYLIAHAEETLPDAAETAYLALLARAERQEPIPYLIGEAPFYGLDFIVTPAVLIPRPETEMLLDYILRRATDRGPRLIVDVGTGSGCLAVTLAHRLPDAEVIAIDVSAEALAIAAQNGARHAPGRVRFVEGNLLNPVGGGIDIIVTNLPYIADDEWTSVSDGVKWYEPVGALRGGSDGLDHFRALIPAAAQKLKPGGSLLMEIGWRQGKAVRRLARNAFPRAEITILPDFAGHDRVVAVEALRV
jgi:release factor glutamine methyltransferase